MHARSSALELLCFANSSVERVKHFKELYHGIARYIKTMQISTQVQTAQIVFEMSESRFTQRKFAKVEKTDCFN